MRVAGAQEILDRAAQAGLYTCDIDEKKFCAPTLFKAMVHPDSDVESEENRKLFFKMMQRKKNIASVMACAIVTEPTPNPPWTCEEDKWLATGLIAIFRCTVTNTETNGVKKYDEEGNVVQKRIYDKSERGRLVDVYEVEPGTPREEDAAMDAAMYMDILVNRGGLKAIRDYYDALQEKLRAADASMASARRSARATDKIEPRLKEDGAPGHGFNNRAKAENGTHGIPNDTHDKIAAEAAKMLIDLWKQPSRSPELNKLDLGVWYHLWTKVLFHYGEFLDPMQPEKAQLNRLWDIIESEFWKIDPAMLLSISEHELDIARQVIERKGRHLLKEKHGGARQRAEARIAAAKKK